MRSPKNKLYKLKGLAKCKCLTNLWPLQNLTVEVFVLHLSCVFWGEYWIWRVVELFLSHTTCWIWIFVIHGTSVVLWDQWVSNCKDSVQQSDIMRNMCGERCFSWHFTLSMWSRYSGSYTLLIFPHSTQFPLLICITNIFLTALHPFLPQSLEHISALRIKGLLPSSCMSALKMCLCDAVLIMLH